MVAPREPQKLAPTVSIGALAKQRGVHRTTLWRTLKRLHDVDSGNGLGGWLCRPNKGKGWYTVNLDLLFFAHPELFAHRFATKEQLEEITERVKVVESVVKAQKVRHNADMALIKKYIRDLDK